MEGPFAILTARAIADAKPGPAKRRRVDAEPIGQTEDTSATGAAGIAVPDDANATGIIARRIAAKALHALPALPQAQYSVAALVGVAFEQVVAVPPDNPAVLFSAEACDCVIVAVRSSDGTRIMAHKQLDRGPIEAFVGILIAAQGRLQPAEYALVGGHDDTREHVDALVGTIDRATQRQWKLTHCQLFGRAVTRSLAMTAALPSDGDTGDAAAANGHGFHAIDFAAVPQQTRCRFRLGALLSVETLSRAERDAVEADLRQLDT